MLGNRVRPTPIRDKGCNFIHPVYPGTVITSASDFLASAEVGLLSAKLMRHRVSVSHVDVLSGLVSLNVNAAKKHWK